MSFRSGRLICILSIVLFYNLPVSSQDDRCQCKNITGIASVPMFQQKSFSDKALFYQSWACSQNFETVNKAVNSGVDALLLGPLFVKGAKFDASSFEERKQTYCSQIINSMNESHWEETLVQYAPSLSHDYVECVKSCKADTLSCWATARNKDFASVSVMYTPPQGQQVASKFTDSSWLPWGVVASERATWHPIDRRVLFPSSTELQVGPNVVVLDRRAHLDPFTVGVKTTRGDCSIDVPAADDADSLYSFSQEKMSIPTMRLDKATVLRAKTIEMNDQSLIVTNGYDLTIDAYELSFVGSPRVIAFEPRDGRAGGENGKPAGKITIQAKKATGTLLRIQNFGEDGAKGPTGGKGGQGGAGSPGAGRQGDCGGGRDGGTGGTGMQGLTGGVGGRGGDGGPVILNVALGGQAGVVNRLQVATSATDPVTSQSVSCGGECGGFGGDGGEGGPGGDGGPGGEGASGKGFCGGTGGGARGPAGPQGNKGPRGGNGGAAAITVAK
jgi:hypothetical protein